MFSNHGRNNVISWYEGEDKCVIPQLLTCQAVVDESRRRFTNIKRRHWDESSLIFLPESCYLDECPHFIRCTDIKSVEENCNKHLKDSQEWRQIELDIFQCDCPDSCRDVSFFYLTEPVLMYKTKGIFLQMLLKYMCQLSINRKTFTASISCCIAKINVSWNVSFPVFFPSKPTWQHKFNTWLYVFSHLFCLSAK